jgi:hypothetical protein
VGAFENYEDWCVIKDFKGSGRSLLNMLSQNLPEGNINNYSKFNDSRFRIRVRTEYQQYALPLR